MPTPDDTDPTDDLDPAEAFSTLGHPLRLDVVTTLHERSEASPVPFSALYEAVDTDGTGRFNYHLGELVPYFISRSDEGYELTAAGSRVARAVTAGTYTDTPELPPFDLDGRCYDCGAADLRGAYEDEHFRVTCRDCEQVVLHVAVPPSLVRGRDPDSFVEAFQRWSRSQVSQARTGICPECGGATEPSAVRNTHDTISFDLLARFECRVCGRTVVTSFGAVAADLPAVEAFHRDRNAPISDRPYWEIPQFMSEESVEIVDRNPLRVRVSFACRGDVCRVELDDDLQPVRTTIVTEDRDR